MQRVRRAARKVLYVMTGVVLSSACVAAVLGRSDPVQVQSRQVPGQEPPLAEGQVAPPQAPPGPRIPPGHPPTPVVSIYVTAPKLATPGRELEYHIIVDNVSQADANHVHVRVPLPAHVRYKTAQPVPGTPPSSGELTWDLGTMKPGQHIDITFAVDVEPGTVDDISCVARVVFEHGECVRTRISKPSIRVRTTGPERAKLYDLLTYTIEVTNNGSVAANDVVLTEELPPGLSFSDSNPPTSGANPLTWKLGTLFPNQPRRVEFKVIPGQSGVHLLKAAVVSGGVKTVEENLSRVLVGEAKITLLKTGPTSRSDDLPATYFLTVSNSGTMPATNIDLRDNLFAANEARSNIQFVGASDDGKLVGEDVRWLLGTLEPGSRRTVSLTLRTLRTNFRVREINNEATVVAERDMTAKSACRTEFTSPAGLTLDIDKSVDPVAVGATAIITFRIRHIGKTSSRNVGLNVTLPDQLQYVDARGPSSATQDGKTVSFASLGEIAGGAEAAYTITVRAERPAEVQVRAALVADTLAKGSKLERVESLTILPESAASAAAPVLEKATK